MARLTDRARKFLAGEALRFDEAHALWQALLESGELSLARAVLSRLRDGAHDATILQDQMPSKKAQRQELCRQEAFLTSKDEELSAAVRHTGAIEILEQEFGDLDDPDLTDAETLGIAGGIYKRKWYDLGQLSDLERSAALYERGARGPLNDDAYTQINAAFLDDMLAYLGNNPRVRQVRAREIRERIVANLETKEGFWNAATRAEACLGLGRYAEATEAVRSVPRPPLWKLETSVRQLATLAHLQSPRPLDDPAIQTFFNSLVPGSSAAVRSAFIGKVGLALSGGGFRASFYHLGVLARLAELDVLRHIDVLSCVSGGSIVGACYWLALRRRLLEKTPLDRSSYIQIISGLIDHFQNAVSHDLRRGVQPSKAAVALRMIAGGQKGALDPEAVAEVLESEFYRPLMPGAGPLFMDDLAFTPADHDPETVNRQPFNPAHHNWLRAHKVPALVINATTVNTGHGWQFTPTWMGESPWTVHDAADIVPRLQWAYYDSRFWRMQLGRAVAASACVPGVFSPLELAAPYEPAMDVRLVDGGVYDNQGTTALVASNCNVLLVSDAACQLLLEPSPKEGVRGLISYAARSMDTLMERVRQTNFGDLSARRTTGLVRGMMFLHIKAGLDADPVRLTFSDEAYTVKRAALSSFGVRKDLQQAIAELRTDLNAFTPEESLSLMACGYQMASKALERDLSHLSELFDTPRPATWSFSEMLEKVTSTRPQDELLAAVKAGHEVVAGGGWFTRP